MPSRLTDIGRRAVIAGGAAFAIAARAPAGGDDDAALRQVLDAVDPAVPGVALARLERFHESRLSPGAAIDLDTVRAGLRIDARLAEAGDRERYALRIERGLGEALAPAAAHAMLLAEVAALSARADWLLRRLGFTGNTVGAGFIAAFAEPHFLYPDSTAGRDAAVADMNRVLDAARARLPADYPRLPGFVLDVAVRRMAPADEAARRAGYRTLPTPGSPGAYHVDLADIARRPRWSLVSVARHELLPGHLLQLPLEALARPHPLRLGYLAGFSEGWAVHAEESAGGPDAGDDDWAELGRTHWLLLRALRGVVDTGIHFAGWTRGRARAMLDDVQGVPAPFAPFDSDLDRIVREPGLRAAEALAWLRLRALRRASARRFPGPRFHAIVLAHGRQRIDRIARRTEI